MSNKQEANEAALPADRQDAERQRLTGVANEFRQEMEALSLQVRDLILAQPPVQLLGYLMSQFHMAIIGGVQDAEEDYRPDKDMLKAFQFVLEYAHAVWSSHADLVDEASPLDEAKAGSLFDVSEQLQTRTMIYCMASAAANIDPARSGRSGDMEFHAKSSWTLIRGHRYQVLEEEFFRFVLAPHADALREAYGMEPDEIAVGVQGIADAMRSGFSTAVEDMMQLMDQAYALVEQTGEDLGAVIARMRDDDPEFQNDASGSVKDMLFGGTCNLSRHTNFTPALLEDLSYAPGENTEFFAPGEFCGTPMRTLPGRVKPAIRLGGEIYATDGQFVRDSAYRAIQRGVCARLPYRDTWLKKQAVLVEQAFPTIFTEQLANARIFNSVFYKDVDTGGWAETDLLVMVGDALLVIEAKAGNLPMQSPATSFKTHERVIQDLVVKAYRQCKRFLAYVASAPEVPLYSLQEGKYIEVGRIKRGDFRVMLPIGLTVEAFTPFSAMAKELPEVEPILGKHPFVSMSVDDLFVLNRFLPTTGALLHYLEVRQQVAGIRNAMLFDEIDHLGAYISDNRIQNYKPTDGQIAWHLGRLVTNIRSVSTDPVLVKKAWFDAYDFATDRAALFLNDYARANDPFAQIGQRSVSVQVTSVVRASDRSFQVKWVEQTYERGSLARTERWTAMLTVAIQPPRTADALRRNPLGLFVEAIDWSRELDAGTPAGGTPEVGVRRAPDPQPTASVVNTEISPPTPVDPIPITEGDTP